MLAIALIRWLRSLRLLRSSDYFTHFVDQRRAASAFFFWLGLSLWPVCAAAQRSHQRPMEWRSFLHRELWLVRASVEISDFGRSVALLWGSDASIGPVPP